MAATEFLYMPLRPKGFLLEQANEEKLGKGELANPG